MSYKIFSISLIDNHVFLQKLPLSVSILPLYADAKFDEIPMFALKINMLPSITNRSVPQTSALYVSN